MIQFTHLKETDPEVYSLVKKEYERQNNGLELIASENLPSESVLEAQASYHTLKYAEGYPGKRYYGGCRIIDKTEQLAIDRACQLFHCNYANVQPHSGSSANMAVFKALISEDEKEYTKILGMDLDAGGHLTHGHKLSFSGAEYDIISYGVDKNGFIDYKDIENKLSEYEPRILIVGASSYSRTIDYKKIREIVDKHNKYMYEDFAQYKDLNLEKAYEGCKCYLFVDMAHVAGLVAAGLHPNPCEYADIVTSTTHKTLRGPRGGLILTNDAEIAKKINSAVFPGIQGGPLENIIAAKAVCFGEALKPEFKVYMQNVLDNMQTLIKVLQQNSVKIVTDGSDNHLALIDLRGCAVNGQQLQDRLEAIGIIANKNAIPFDTKNKLTTSGLRIGTAAITSRGLGKKEMTVIGEIISRCVYLSDEDYLDLQDSMKIWVSDICKKYPLYKD